MSMNNPNPDILRSQAREFVNKLSAQTGVDFSKFANVDVVSSLPTTPLGDEPAAQQQHGKILLSLSGLAKAQSLNPRFTFEHILAHELGHALDWEAGGGTGHFSTFGASQPMNNILQQYRKIAESQGLLNPGIQQTNPGLWQYLTSHEELWAESFAGHVTGVTRLSGMDELLKSNQDLFLPRLPALPRSLTGESAPIRLPSGGSIDAQYQVRDLADVIASHQAMASGGLRNRAAAGEYPAGLQPRDYNQSAEHAKVLRMAQDLDPRELLSQTSYATGGPSTITPGGIVLAGNSRQMALEMAIHKGTYEPYKKELIAKAAQYGLDPDMVARMQYPALYRTVNFGPDSPDAVKFARASNISTTQTQSVEDAAAALRYLISDDVLGSMQIDADSTFSEAVTRSDGRPFRESLLASLRREAPQLEGQVFQQGTKTAELSDYGTEFVRKMLLSKILPPKLIQSLGTNRKAMFAGIEKAIPQLLNFRHGDAEADITPQLNEALGIFARNPDIKTRGDMERILSQKNLEGEYDEPVTPGGEMMLDFLVQHRDKPAEIRKGLVGLAGALGDKGGMFGSELGGTVDLASEALGVKAREGAEFGRPAGSEPLEPETPALPPPAISEEVSKVQGAGGEKGGDGSGTGSRGRGRERSRAFPPVMPAEMQPYFQPLYEKLRKREELAWATSGKDVPEHRDETLRRVAMRQAHREMQKLHSDTDQQKWLGLSEQDEELARSLPFQFWREPGSSRGFRGGGGSRGSARAWAADEGGSAGIVGESGKPLDSREIARLFEQILQDLKEVKTALAKEQYKPKEYPSTLTRIDDE